MLRIIEGLGLVLATIGIVLLVLAWLVYVAAR